MMLENFLAIILIPILSFINIWEVDSYSSSSEKAIVEVINQTADVIEKKYEVERIGHGVSGALEFLEISFQSPHPMSKDDARRMLVECIEEFLSQINSNKKIRAYLKTYPFTCKDVGIALYIRDKDNNFVFHPNISVAHATSQGIIYRTRDPVDTPSPKGEGFLLHHYGLSSSTSI